MEGGEGGGGEEGGTFGGKGGGGSFGPTYNIRQRFGERLEAFITLFVR